ncbi:LOW QUALITY PROTEIN: hypothetical protein CsSME_00001405 [Camellia sinensis var. sinensis]
MAPPKYRGAISNGFQFSLNMGALLANLINFGTEKLNGDWGWRISLAIGTLPTIVLTLGVLFFLQETPNSVIQCTDNHQKAKSILQKIRGTEDVEAELDDLINASAIAKTITHPFKKITKRKYRPQLVPYHSFNKHQGLMPLHSMHLYFFEPHVSVKALHSCLQS